MLKKKIIYILISLASLLLVINILIETFASSAEKPVKQELSKKQIERLFISSLLDNGISNKWISAKTISGKTFDSLTQVYYVNIPSDLRVVKLIGDISDKLDKKPVQIEAEEITNHSNSTLKLYSNGILKLQAYLTSTKEVYRESAEITFLIECIDCSYSELPHLLNSVTIPYTLLFSPTKDLKNSLDDIKNSIPSFAILIDDNMDDDQYELETDASKSKLSRNLINLISDFGRETKYIIDDKSAIYNSIVFPFIRDELSERKIKTSKLSDFTDLRDKPSDQIRSIFKFHCENGRGKQLRTLVVTLDEFFLLQPDIAKFERLGDKFFPL